MHVLELGCGPGEVTEVIARIIGPSGTVLAIDRDEGMLASARSRIGDTSNVRFARADLNGEASYLVDIEHASFDAIAGRRVLMYLAEPSSVIARLLPWLRKGGLVVFEEADSSAGPGRVDELPAHEKAVSWLNAMLEREIEMLVTAIKREIDPSIVFLSGMRFCSVAKKP